MSAMSAALEDAMRFLATRGYVVEPRGDRWRPHRPDAEWLLTGHGARDLLSGAGLVETVADMRWLEDHADVQAASKAQKAADLIVAGVQA